MLLFSLKQISRTQTRNNSQYTQQNREIDSYKPPHYHHQSLIYIIIVIVCAYAGVPLVAWGAWQQPSAGL